MKVTNKFQDQSIEDLRAIYLDLSRELFRLKSELCVIRKLEKPHRIKAAKRDRARVLTALGSKGGTLN